jgi:hypothetical protein
MPSLGSQPLRGAFVLSGFALRAKLEPLLPGADKRVALASLAHEETVWTSWGPSRGRQLLRLLSLIDALDRVPCWRLESGSPEATADLIERTLEEA